MAEYDQTNEQPLFVPQLMDGRNAQQGNTVPNINDVCRKYMNYHVIAEMADGKKMEGIIEDINDQGVVMLIPEDVNDAERYFYGPGGRRRFRRFNRFLFPFILFVPPFFYPYPYFY
ncbi:hypothetical protein M3N64_07600 [Sporolactobacillus sp. CPB3-1]|uniref:Uncharacterized protein n=1 Tax=Sporolactobacillus mangiferae TaxID=2940498 RepID=A0ABT0MB30_9BACL|nr:hypothetical protein [Sporolactobacillus mangiferae]MCL1631813.1 hypothetical protein [Sporolactobacillus mangiferae]